MGKIQDKSFEFPEGTEVSAEAIDLLEQMLNIDP